MRERERERERESEEGGREEGGRKEGGRSRLLHLCYLNLPCARSHYNSGPT